MMSRVKWLSLGLVLCVLASCSGSGLPECESSATIPDAVREELARLGAEDQEVRQDLSPGRMQDTVFAKSMLRGDSLRSARLQAIVAECGWPDSLRAGGEAAGAAFLILQHSPMHEFQEQMLPVLETHAAAGSVPRSDAAMLIDRVLMHQGVPQRYGTQFTMEEGRLVLHPVENEASLDERRSTMELPSMEEYIRLLEEQTGIPVTRPR